MKLVVTGGGTGGHVYPALEIALSAREAGWDVLYLGSLRGQEGAACARVGIAFEGFASQPLYSMRTPRGWKASVAILRASVHAKRSIRAYAPDALLSTGGYSSAPVMTAARSLRRPYVVHEQNSVPGRTNRMIARGAMCVATTFHAADRAFPGARIVRTGLPVRSELRAAADGLRSAEHVLVVGGSQGAGPINSAAPVAAARMDGPWVHVAGASQVEATQAAVESAGLTGRYAVHAFLESEPMAQAYAGATIAIARGGAGTLAELAAFGIPSVIVPFPLAFADHQSHNAEEFVSLGAATRLPQDMLDADCLFEAAQSWLSDSARREAARVALKEWDVPDASQRILALLADAGSSGAKP